MRYLDEETLQQFETLTAQFKQFNTLDLEQHILTCRQQYIDIMLAEIVTYPEAERQHLTERIDALLTHKILGIPIFFRNDVAHLSTDVYLDWDTAF